MPAINDDMSETNLPPLGDRNTIVLARSCDINGRRHLFGDEIEVDAKTARQLIEDNLGQLASMEWDDGHGLRMTGQAIQIRKI